LIKGICESPPFKKTGQEQELMAQELKEGGKRQGPYHLSVDQDIQKK
jgi:hypothetical protein